MKNLSEYSLIGDMYNLRPILFQYKHDIHYTIFFAHKNSEMFYVVNKTDMW